MNNGVYLITQNAADLLDETIRNNLEGRVGVVQLDPVLTHLYHAFDTRPPHLVQVP